MHIANDVERSVLVLEIVPKWLAFKYQSINILGLLKNVNMTKPFALQAAQ